MIVGGDNMKKFFVMFLTMLLICSCSPNVVINNSVTTSQMITLENNYIEYDGNMIEISLPAKWEKIRKNHQNIYSVSNFHVSDQYYGENTYEKNSLLDIGYDVLAYSPERL